MMRLLFFWIWVGSLCFAQSEPIPLKQLSGFPVNTAKILAEYGVFTDHELLLVGAINPEGIASALGAPIQNVRTTIAEIWRRKGAWVDKWAGECKSLLLNGSLRADLQKTPLLALTLFPPEKVRALAELHVRSAEALYAMEILEPGFLVKALKIDGATAALYLDYVRQGAPHVKAAIDRRQYRPTKTWSLESLLDGPSQ